MAAMRMGGEEVAALGGGVAEVDGGDFGEGGAAVAGAEGEAGVAAGFDVGEGFEAWCGADEDGGGGGEAGADDGHVAGVVDDAVFLLEGGFVFLVDDDEAQIGEGEEEGGAGADDDGGGAVGDGAPGDAAGAGGEVAVPDGGGDAEAAGEAVEPLGAECNFGEEDEGLAAGGETLGDGFEVDFRLAGPGDAIEEGDAEGSCGRRLRGGFGRQWIGRRRGWGRGGWGRGWRRGWRRGGR